MSPVPKLVAGLLESVEWGELEECRCGEYAELKIQCPVRIESAWFGHSKHEEQRVDLTEDVQQRVAALGDGELCLSKGDEWPDPAPWKMKQICIAFRRPLSKDDDDTTASTTTAKDADHSGLTQPGSPGGVRKGRSSFLRFCGRLSPCCSA